MNKLRNVGVLNVILAIAGFTLAAVVVFAAIAIPSILAGTSNSEALQKSSDLSNCRAAYSARSTDAQVKMFERKAELDVISNHLVRALAEDRSLIPGILAESASKETEVLDAITTAEQRVTEFQDAVARAAADPDGFLTSCREQP